MGMCMKKKNLLLQKWYLPLNLLQHQKLLLSQVLKSLFILNLLLRKQ